MIDLSPLAEMLRQTSFDTIVPVVTAVVIMIEFAVRRMADLKAAKKHSTKAAFDTALASDDLTALGKYLREDLGEVTLAAYVHSLDVRKRVDSYLDRLAAFVAAPADSENEALSTAEPEELQAPIPHAAQWEVLPNDPPEIVRAIAAIRSGEEWNGLAGLRRDLERKLRNEWPDQPEPRSGRVIAPPDAEFAFRRFWRTASRAIHGVDVSDAEVIAAIDDARTVYSVLSHLKQEHGDS